MKKYNLLISGLLMFSAGFMSSCSDFDDINTNPMSTGAEKIKPYYSLGSSLIKVQQNPDVAERVFILSWASFARQDGEDGINASSGRTSDEYYGREFSNVSTALTSCNTAIDLCDNTDEGNMTAHEKEFYPNLKQISRIWRAYLLSELADNFGPSPIDGFQGVVPEFKSEKEVYYYMLSELKDAIDKIDTSIEPNSTEKDSDPIYKFDATKWRKYAVSMRMRLAMRLSECDEAKAKTEFEDAVAQGDGIIGTDETFRVEEHDGWDDWTGVMSRTWDWQNLSATMANLTTNLGGTNSVTTLKSLTTDNAVYEGHTRDASTYAGVKLDKHWSANTDNPTKQMWFDALPTKVDPRALKYFYLPGDYKNRKVNGYISFPYNEKAPQIQICTDDDGNEEARVDATYSWNGLTAGWGNDDDAVNNGLINGSSLGSWGYGGTVPALADEYRNSKNYRVFFGPWETYFLLAEAATRGWNVKTDAETAYYAGIKSSFDYNDMSDLYTDYINSENYNRVGTSVKFTHTTEPVATQMSYVDGYTKTEGTMTYNYPNSSNILYKGKKLNDQLTKIITQLYIANTPWLPLENWSNHRRLGLPFFEIPTSTSSLPYMPSWSESSANEPQSIDLFVQRMKYPTSLANADEVGYQQAVSLLKGGKDSNLTPLWWALGGH